MPDLADATYDIYPAPIRISPLLHDMRISPHLVSIVPQQHTADDEAPESTDAAKSALVSLTMTRASIDASAAIYA